MNKLVLVIVGIVLLIVGAAGGFYGGITYAQSQSRDVASTFERQRGVGSNGTGQAAAAGPCGFVGRAAASGGATSGGTGTNGGAGGAGGGFNRQSGGSNQGGAGNPFQQFGNCVARGQVKSVDPSTGTVQISTPVNVVTVKVNNRTTISKTDTGSLSDIKVGDRVTAFSQSTGDTPDASLIQIQRAPGQP